MNGMFARSVAMVLCVGIWACSDDTPTVDCGAEAGSPQIAAYVGAVQTDGSVTVYGTVQSALTVRSLYVAGVEVTPSANGFNYRTWSVSVPEDRLVAYAKGNGQAALPVMANIYGGCISQLPLSEEPVVYGISTDAGRAPIDGAVADTGDAATVRDTLEESSDGGTNDGAAVGD